MLGCTPKDLVAASSKQARSLRFAKVFLALSVVLVGLLVLRAKHRGPRASGPLPQQAYVWQRVWAEPVVDAVKQEGQTYASLIVLGAEINVIGDHAKVVRIEADYDALRQTGVPIGVALRVGSYAGPFDRGNPISQQLVAVARDLVVRAKAAGLRLSELQIDFDCATSKLDGYRQWISQLRAAIEGTPITITALPSWLGHPAFSRLVDETDGFVLQAHALERPSHSDARLVLCDSAAAIVAVERASTLGRPFRVALPTYGYRIAFGADGKFLGLSAEGPASSFPSSATVRELWADPNDMADLVRRWSADRPASLKGLLWYRLPVASDTMSWRAVTLAAVREGRTPRRDLRVEVRHPEAALIEIDLLNAGETDAPEGLRVEVMTGGAHVVASDALAGFAFEEATPGRLVLRSVKTGFRLRAGERATIGWLRLENNAEVIGNVVAER